MTPEELTDDAKVILLLCGHFGKDARPEDGSSMLGTADWGRFSAFLHDKGLRPASLLETSVLDDLQAGMCPIDIQRVRSLLARGAAMSFAVEAWMNDGLWVLCRSDNAYPDRLKRQLREMAPPILYGAGDASLLNRGGLAIVGSRNIGPDQEFFASQVANRCSCDGVQVVSGGARGIDQVAMGEALDAGGTVVGVLAENLLKKSLQRVHREAIHDRRLALLSTVHPEAPFNVGVAMGRNKLIYALADFGLVVQSEFNKGGTWTGAVEELDRIGGRPIFFHPDYSPKRAIDALFEKGAGVFPELIGGEPVDAQLSAAAEGLANQANHSFNGELSFGEGPAPKPEPAPASEPDESPHPVTEPESIAQPAIPDTVFDAVWPLLRTHLATPTKPVDLAEVVSVRKGQAEDWIKQAQEAGLVRKLSKPVRYVLDDGDLLNLK